LAEIAIMRVNGLRLARQLDPVTGQTLLQRMVGHERDGGPNKDGSLVTVERRLARRSRPDVAGARSRPARRTR